MLTKVQTEIIQYLEAQGGSTCGCFRLIVCELGRSWTNGWRSLRHLERRGYISITHRPGCRSYISLRRYDK